jgi:molybdenum cofactor cytidylyltransferase
MTRDGLGCRSVASIEGQRRDVSVHGVVLAAGTSNRYGAANKLLAERNGTPIVQQATRTMVESQTGSVTVVVGYEADRVWNCVSNLPVSRRENNRYERGQSTSVHEGIAAARAQDADAVVLSLGDMPDIDVESVDALIEAYERDAGDALALAHDCMRGNPVLFDASHFEALRNISGDIGGRDVLRSAQDGLLVEVSDPGVTRDIDTPEDL